jgi:ribosomal protein S18 acetylase RimI-like enzyme
MEIRRLVEEDYHLLAEAVRVLLSEQDRVSGPASNTHLRGALANESCYFVLCLIGSSPAGYLSAYRFPAVEHVGFHVYLYDIIVAEEHRLRGIASAMIEKLKEQCKRDRVTRIWVGTSLENEAAQRTFEATGAQRVRETYIEYIYQLDNTF